MVTRGPDPRSIRGPSVVHPWAIRGPSVGHPWAIRGPSVGHPWAIRGPSVGHPWAIRGPSVVTCDPLVCTFRNDPRLRHGNNCLLIVLSSNRFSAEKWNMYCSYCKRLFLLQSPYPSSWNVAFKSKTFQSSREQM